MCNFASVSILLLKIGRPLSQLARQRPIFHRHSLKGGPDYDIVGAGVA